MKLHHISGHNTVVSVIVCMFIPRKSIISTFTKLEIKNNKNNHINICGFLCVKDLSVTIRGSFFGIEAISKQYTVA